MTSDLLPCPFCGGRAEIWRAHPENPPRKAWIACMGRCAVLTKEHTSDAEAITAWNTRAKADQIMALEGAAEAELAALKAEAVEVVEALANAADGVGVAYFDSDDMPPVVETMQDATLAARDLLAKLKGEAR